MMILNDIWFVLFVVVISGYLILDGFDMGVGILHLALARNDDERRVSLNSIGPVWDGNEVWIVLGGGALFAAFPLVYASLFSGFYSAMMLVLLVMILRTCAIEFRSKRESAQWRSLWDAVFSLTSLGLALLLGVAFGNIISGAPIDPAGNMRITLIELLNPYALLVGVTTVVMLTMHGALYLELRTEGTLQARVRKMIPRLMLAFFALIAVVVVATVALRPHLVSNYQTYIWPAIFPLAALAALLVAWRTVQSGQYLKAFLASSVTIALLVATAAAGMFPNLLISTTASAFNLTIYNAASESNTLTVMLVIALIGLPLVFLYQAAAYYIFRGKTRLDKQSY
jgi:cytochrome d ubiquinol oxidase subunit II